jgi:serine/threonine protein kinase
VAKKLPVRGSSPQDLARLETEVRVYAKLRHPNIVHYLGTRGLAARQDCLFICLEYASGGTIAARIAHHRKACSPFEPDLAISWIAQLASAVSYMHTHHVLHRDLSAQNILLTGTDDIKVGDFGLSKAGKASQFSVRGRTVCGTPNYFSPEMINGELYGAASDTWAVGVLAHEILTLKHPFGDSNSLGHLLQRIVKCDYDRAALDEAPYHDALKDVASGSALLHVDQSQRLTLQEMLSWPMFEFKSATDSTLSSPPTGRDPNSPSKEATSPLSPD